jgi:hypothetical protein
VVHGLGTGSDTKLGWVLCINALCVGAVLSALWWRLARGWSVANAPRRGAAVLLSIAVPAAVVAWAASGPLRPGWAKRAGTPAALIASASAPRAPTPATTPSGTTLTVPFSARFDGTQRQAGPDSSGLLTVTIAGTFQGDQKGRLTVVLTGQPADGGGVDLTGSQVQLGPASAPDEYRGRVIQLTGPGLVAELTGPQNAAITATIELRLSPGQNTVTGSVRVN